MIPPSPDIVFPFDLAFNCVSYNHLEVYLDMKPDTVKKAEDHFSLILPSTKSLFLSYCQQSYHFFRLLYIFNIYCFYCSSIQQRKNNKVRSGDICDLHKLCHDTFCSVKDLPKEVWCESANVDSRLLKI